jgi:hypothetical protein
LSTTRHYAPNTNQLLTKYSFITRSLALSLALFLANNISEDFLSINWARSDVACHQLARFVEQRFPPLRIVLLLGIVKHIDQSVRQSLSHGSVRRIKLRPFTSNFRQIIGEVAAKAAAKAALDARFPSCYGRDVCIRGESNSP